MNVLLNGRHGKVGTTLVPALLEAGHHLADSLDDAEIMVDFTGPDAVLANVLDAIAAGMPAVVGTSGWQPTDVHAAAAAAGVAVFHAPNFALGAMLMMRFAREAGRHFRSAEIIELHQDTKRDAPSGTALVTAASLDGETPIHSVRLPGLVAHQVVLFGGPGEILTIRHDATSREAYVSGVLLALERIHALPPGVTIGLDALL